MTKLTINKERLKVFLLLNLGVFLLSAGIYFFKFPNHFSTGGVSGLSVLLGKFLPASAATVMSVMNILFLFLGFAFLNKGFGFKTTYCSIALSGFTQLFEWLYPMTAPMTSQKMLELMFSVILPAIGSAILFTNGASSGGTDIIAMILQKFTDFDIGKCLIITDFLIAFATLFIFGIETCLFSVLGLILKAFVVDVIIENISTKKIAIVITSKRDLVTDFIAKKLKRGVTEWDCIGGFTGDRKTVLLSALSRQQAIYLRQYVKEIDEKSFIVINNSTEVIGKGFRRGY